MSYIDLWSTLWLAMLSVWTSKPKLASGCCERLCDVTGRLPRTDCRLVVEFQAFSWTLVHVTEIQEGLQLWCDEKHHSKWNESDSKFRKIQWSLSHKGNGNRLGMHSIFMEGLLAPWTWPPLVPHPVVEVFIGFHMFFFSNVYFKSFLHHFCSLFAIATFSSYLPSDLWSHPISLWGFSTWDVQVARQDLIVPSRRKLKQAQHEGSCWRLKWYNYI